MVKTQASADQVECPKCKAVIHKFAAICYSCNGSVSDERRNALRMMEPSVIPTPGNDFLFFFYAALIFAITILIAWFYQHSL